MESTLSDCRIRFEALGQCPTFSNFLFFVKQYIAPHMEMQFIEEDFIREIYVDFLLNRKSRYVARQMSRGLGKSEIGIWITIWCAVCKPLNIHSGKQISEQLIITSADDSLSTIAARIKHYFYESPELKRFIPIDIKSIKEEKKNSYWNSSELYLLNGSMIHLRTIKSRSIRGNHVDRVWGDDLVGENSALEDKKIETIWFYAVDGTTTAKNAVVNVTGTPRRLTDLMNKMNENAGYDFRKMPVIDEKGNLISKRWDKRKVEETKKRVGSVVFQCEYLLDPIDDSTSLIRAEWIKHCYVPSMCMINTEAYLKNPKRNLDGTVRTLRPEWAKAIYLGVDFAFADRITADKSVFFIIGEYKKEEKTYFVLLDMIIKKGWSGGQQLEFIRDQLNPVWKFDLIGLEENSLTAIRDKITNLNLPIRRYWTGNRDEKQESKAPEKHYTTVSKRNLINRLGTSFENKEIMQPVGDEYSKENAQILLNECVSFAQEEGKLIEIGVHPDAPIALAMAIEASRGWNRGVLVI